MFILDNGVLPRLPDTLEEAVSFVEPFRILDLTGAKRKPASPTDESDTSFVDDLNNENEADDGGTSDESSTPSPLASYLLFKNGLDIWTTKRRGSTSG